MSILLRRLLYSIPIALAVSAVCFALVFLGPVDPLKAVLPPDASLELIEKLKADYGFDKPVPVQFAKWVWRAAQGDLGLSLATGRPVREEIGRAISNTFVLAFFACGFGFTLGLALGFVAGYFNGTWIDRVVTAFAVTGVSVPHYWLGMVLVILFSVVLNWLPAMGMGASGSADWAWDWEHIRFVILPAFTLSVIPTAIIARTVRALVADILSREFVSALIAKGLDDRGVFRHVVKNAAPTALAVMGHPARLPARRLDPGGDGVLLAGHRVPALGGDLPARPAAAAGDDPFPGAVLRLPQPARRCRPAFPRSPHPPHLAQRGYWTAVALKLTRDKVAVVCAAIIVLLILMAIFAPWIAPEDPLKSSILNRLKPIGTPNHLLGTDELGRDMLSRLIFGGRLSLLMGITPVLCALAIGSLLGVTAGFVGGRTNTAIMRTIDVFYAFPSVLLAVAISGALGAGIVNAIVSLTIVFIPPIARVAEIGHHAGARSLDYVEAARASGAGAFTIIRVHILGNVMGPVFIYATGLLSVCMILAAGLSFLGLGTKPPLPEWGLMLNTLRTAIFQQPWVAALPGAMIFIVSFCCNLMADGLRSAMDVHK